VQPDHACPFLTPQAKHGAWWNVGSKMTNTLDNLPADLARHRILDTKQAAAFRGVSVKTWRRLYLAGKVPEPIKISAAKYGWRVGDLIDLDAPRAA